MKSLMVEYISPAEMLRSVCHTFVYSINVIESATLHRGRIKCCMPSVCPSVCPSIRPCLRLSRNQKAI